MATNRAALSSPAEFSADEWDWHVKALCRQRDPSMFFHPDGERGKARRRRQQDAKRVCAECPVMLRCREHSLVFEEPFGVWGGLTEEERSQLLPSRAVNLRTHHAKEPAGRR